MSHSTHKFSVKSHGILAGDTIANMGGTLPFGSWLPIDESVLNRKAVDPSPQDWPALYMIHSIHTNIWKSHVFETVRAGRHRLMTE
jgi:hypothetical protein